MDAWLIVKHDKRLIFTYTLHLSLIFNYTLYIRSGCTNTHSCQWVAVSTLLPQDNWQLKNEVDTLSAQQVQEFKVVHPSSAHVGTVDLEFILGWNLQDLVVLL